MGGLWLYWALALALPLFAVCSQFEGGKDANFISNNDNDDDITLERINDTQNFRVLKRAKQDNRDWYADRELKMVHCVRRARCETLTTNVTCLGVQLKYMRTSFHLTYSESYEHVLRKLEQYKQLMHIPKCWAVIQPLLCATYLPRCEKVKGDDMVYLPSYEMCKVTMEPCRMVYNTSFFPEFLKCNETFFPPKCDNEIREKKFNTTGQCMSPLIKTDKPLHFYEGMEGCGLPCRDPLYTADEHRQVHQVISWGAGVCLALNLFTVATFLIDWRSANKYPALVIFYINVCYAVASMGWLVQFGVMGSRDDIVCSKDGTRRMGEPSADENLSCVIVFVLVYYFMIAACVWFVIFTYAWHMSFKALGKIQERIDKKAAYFHLAAWSLPLVMTIATLAMGEVDGWSVTGICFVGYLNSRARVGLLLAPLVTMLAVGGYFLTRGLLRLISVRVRSREVISRRAASKIRQTIARCSATAALVTLAVVATCWAHAHEFRNLRAWQDAFRDYVVCQLTGALEERGGEACALRRRPSVVLLKLRLFCAFAVGALMATWVWTPTAVASWHRYIARKCGCEPEAGGAGGRRAHKHELIARAYRRRGELAARGRVSISLGGSRADPVGLCLDPAVAPDHTPESGELSSTWAANLPRLVHRRGALVGAPAAAAAPARSLLSLSSTADRRNSQDSQISFSLRHVSVESRRNSLDSQLSVKIAEMKTKVATRRRGKQKTSRRRARAAGAQHLRKETTSSIESQIGRYVLQAFASNNPEDSIRIT